MIQNTIRCGSKIYKRNKRGIISIKMESKKQKIISSFFKSVDENLCKSDASSITQNPEEEIVRRCTDVQRLFG